MTDDADDADVKGAKKMEKYEARKITPDYGGSWWWVFMVVDDGDYPNGVLVATICNHNGFFDPEKMANVIAESLNKGADE